jgi:3-hydroxyacyl-CoA dehydrogenase / enoyl-CoA hydratase / 3-hydroxybutyryl-CoA epimerase
VSLVIEPDGLAALIIDRPDDRVNALNPELLEVLAADVRAARANTDLNGLVVRSAKPDQWLAGADLKQLPRASRAALETLSRQLQAICDELAWLPYPTVAMLNGPALGGGCELALACDYRIAIDRPGVRIGQPEVNLGLVPAGGGTQRLPRLVGLERGLDLILSGRQLDTRRAQWVGLLDAVVHPTVLDDAARAWIGRGKRPMDRPLHLAIPDLLELTPAGRRFMYRQARQAVLRRTHGQYPAPLRALECIATGLEHGMAAGLDLEAEAFADLATSDAARHLIWLFLSTQSQKRRRSASQGRSSRIPPGDAQRSPVVGVVGAGFMGAGIAEVAAVAGLTVRLRDVSAEALGRGMGSVRRLVDRGRFGSTRSRAILQRVSGGLDYSGFAHADAVVEAVFEDLRLKQTVLAEIEAVVPETTLVASNTSALPIGRIAAGAQHPERVVGMHFFSPVHRMPLLEVVRGPAASDQAVQQAVDLGIRLGKTPIVVNDAPGFYTSRVLGAMLNEALVLLTEGAGIEAVDAAITAFGFPVGPFVLYDEVGLGVAAHVGDNLAQAFGDRVPRVDVISKLIASGATGRQAGRGFYRWSGRHRLDPRPARTPNPEVTCLLGSPPPRTFSQAEIQERLVLLFVNEAACCLEEGVLRSPADGDLGAVLGLGFPPIHGGPFHYADKLPHLSDTLARLAERHGPRYAPSPVLTTTKGTFFDDPA